MKQSGKEGAGGWGLEVWIELTKMDQWQDKSSQVSVLEIEKVYVGNRSQ